jgi:hypothetical protein
MLPPSSPQPTNPTPQSTFFGVDPGKISDPQGQTFYKAWTNAQQDPTSPLATKFIQGVKSGQYNDMASAAGIDITQHPNIFTTQTSPSSLPGLGLAAMPGQEAAIAGTRALTAGNTQHDQQAIASLSDMASRFITMAHNETDPAKKSSLLQSASDAAKSISQIGGDDSDIQKQIESASLPGVAPLPVEASAARKLEVGAGRGISAAGAATLSAPSIGGGAMGLGQGLEEGGSPEQIAGDTALGLIGGKIAGAVLPALTPDFVNKGISYLGEKGSGAIQSLIEKYPILGKDLTPEAWRGALDQGNKVLTNTLEGTSFSDMGKSIQGAVKNMAGGNASVDEQYAKIAGAYKKAFPGNPNKYDTDVFDTLSRELPNIGVEDGTVSPDNDIKTLQTKQDAENAVRQPLLKSTGEYVNLDATANDAKANIKQNYGGSQQESALAKVDKELNSYKSQLAPKGFTDENGDFKIPVQDADTAKIKLYKASYAHPMSDPEVQTQAGAGRVFARSLRNSINDSIEGSGSDVLKAMNEHYGKLQDAQDFLESIRGKNFKAPAYGRFFPRILGMVAGSGSGIPGEILGGMAADKLVSVMSDPNIPAWFYRKAMEDAEAKSPGIVKQALDQIAQNNSIAESRLKLPESKTIFGGPSTVDHSGINPKEAQEFSNQENEKISQNTKDVKTFNSQKEQQDYVEQQQKEAQAIKEIQGMLEKSGIRSKYENLSQRFKTQDSWIKFVQNNPALENKIKSVGTTPEGIWTLLNKD